MSHRLVIIKEHLWHNAEVKERLAGVAEPASWMEPWRSGSFEVTGGKDIRGKIEDKHKARKPAC